MDNKTKNRIKNIAADILVSPLTAIAASKEMVQKFNETENGQKAMNMLKRTGREVSDAVKTASGKKKTEKSKEAVKGVAGKIGGVFTGGIGKVNEFLHDNENDNVSCETAENAEKTLKNTGNSSSDTKKSGENSNYTE